MAAFAQKLSAAMNKLRTSLLAIAFLLPTAAGAQRVDPVYVEDRFNQLQQSITLLTGQIEQLQYRNQQLQQQLDDKIAENEELVKTMQKSRTEAIRRQDQQKREADDKIAFLLHQLRTAESRRVADDNHSVGSGASKHHHNNNHHHSSSGGGNSARSEEGLAFSVANRNSSTHGATGAFSRPSSAAATSAAGAAGASPGWGQQPNNTLRSSVSASGVRPPSDSMLSELARLDPRDVNKEIERRWTSEKERREQLEKRNAEMVRELKQLRAAAAKNQSH